MPITRHEALQKIAQTSKGVERAELLKNNEIRNAVLSSGANVTIYVWLSILKIYLNTVILK